MDVATTETDPKTARRKLKLMNEAAARLGDKFNDDDKLLLKCYRELAAGRKLIDVNKAFKDAGLNLAGFPKLAIARADRRKVTWNVSGRTRWVNGEGQWVKTGGGEFTYRIPNRRIRLWSEVHRWTVPAETFLAQHLGETSKRGVDLTAMVPYVPAHLRPPYSLGNYFILFEANWFWDAPVSSPDPLLLKQISGPLMSIYAAWDLSGLEQQIFDAAGFNR